MLKCSQLLVGEVERLELVGERQERWLFWKPAAPPLAEPNAPLLANTPVFVTIHGYSPAAAARQTRLADGGRKRGVVSPQTQRLDHGKLV